MYTSILSLKTCRFTGKQKVEKFEFKKHILPNRTNTNARQSGKRGKKLTPKKGLICRQKLTQKTPGTRKFQISLKKAAQNLFKDQNGIRIDRAKTTVFSGRVSGSLTRALSEELDIR